jgi:hypothetical protein
LIRSFRYRLELLILHAENSISDLIRRGIPESIHLALNAVQSNVLMLNDWIDIPDLVQNDSEEALRFDEPYCVVADLNRMMRSNFACMKCVPKLQLKLVPTGYTASPFNKMPLHICSATKKLECTSTGPNRGLKFCGICN